MEDFDTKIENLLKRFNHIKDKENWKDLCFAMFLDYQSELFHKEVYQRAYNHELYKKT